MGRIGRRGTAFSALAVTIGVTGAIGWTGAGSAAAQSCLSVNGTNIAGTPAECDSSAANASAAIAASLAATANADANHQSLAASAAVNGGDATSSANAGTGHSGAIAAAAADNGTASADAGGGDNDIAGSAAADHSSSVVFEDNVAFNVVNSPYFRDLLLAANDTLTKNRLIPSDTAIHN